MQLRKRHRLVTFVPGRRGRQPYEGNMITANICDCTDSDAGRIPCATIFCISALRFVMLSSAAWPVDGFPQVYGLKSCGTRPV